jgi:hypothetical protein
MLDMQISKNFAHLRMVSQNIRARIHNRAILMQIVAIFRVPTLSITKFTLK